MSLAPSEQQLLSEIESRLRRSDLQLAARLAFFGWLAFRRPGPARELLSPWRARRRRVIRMVVLAVVAGAGIVLGALALGGF